MLFAGDTYGRADGQIQKPDSPREEPRWGDSVWKFGEEVGMTTLSTLSKYIFRRQGGESYKERMYPNLTLADVGVREGDTVEFAGDFDPVAPAPGACSRCWDSSNSVET